ncbi:MAG TPA: aminotransferase class I/II-fold pyridoxal phosphate-dependent enzyme [Solirubrobacteraceae bacterium]|nr:aminotransferase class I/II-fold pyridoxal phosphate-dependent enzyme [Solirubrobacteraceae bacterium]
MREADRNGDPLAVDREAMRAYGYRTVDMLVRRLCDPSIPPLRRASPQEMRDRLSRPPPASGQNFDAILDRLERDVLPFMSRGDHPGFLAFIPFSGTWPGALGDFIASACNIYAGSWMESAGPTQLELEVLGWFKQWIGYPAGAGGVLLGGGSAANLTALACARETLVGGMSDDLVGYVSDQAHSSLARAARVLGFRPEQLRVLPSDDRFRLDPDVLAAAMDADVRAGRRPLFVSATAGTTNTGAIDPLGALAELCRERGVWLHVDAAYGGFAVLTERGRQLLRGIDAADSVTLDPHKWLYQPYECGALLVRDDAVLRTAFQMTPDYLQDSFAGDEINLSDRGVQLTRSSRALKVWASLQYFGVDAFAAAIDRSLDLAERVRERVEASEALDLMAPPSLGVVCFRRRFPDAADDDVDGHNAGLVVALEQSGLGLVSSTTLNGRYALRVCVLNHTTGAADVDRVIDFFESAEPTALGARAAAGSVAAYQRDDLVRATPLRRRTGGGGRRGVAVETISGLALFEQLAERDLERIAALGRIDLRGEGERVVEQWEAAIDFYVILEGRVEVLVGDERVAELSSGEFFGELAALDWGGGYGYPRVASVRTLQPTTLLTFPGGSMNEIARDHPPIARRIRRVGLERLERNRR